VREAGDLRLQVLLEPRRGDPALRAGRGPPEPGEQGAGEVAPDQRAGRVRPLIVAGGRLAGDVLELRRVADEGPGLAGVGAGLRPAELAAPPPRCGRGSSRAAGSRNRDAARIKN
jgi:hypothetical protein